MDILQANLRLPCGKTNLLLPLPKARTILNGSWMLMLLQTNTRSLSLSLPPSPSLSLTPSLPAV